MSFILDALKRSENERQRTVGPSLADAPLRRARVDRPWWAVAVVALLVINLGVLIVVLMRDKPDTAPASTASMQPASSPVAQPTYAAPQTALPPTPPANPSAMPAPDAGGTRASPAVRSLADEAGTPSAGDGMDHIDPQMRAALAAASAAPAGSAMVRPIQPPAVAPLPRDATVGALPAAGNTDSRENEVLPTAGDLAAGGTTLPELKLDIHVFSKNPAERFVFVNMRKYLEGQTLQEGPVLERITTDGVVLNQHGLRYALPRQ